MKIHGLLALAMVYFVTFLSSQMLLQITLKPTQSTRFGRRTVEHFKARVLLKIKWIAIKTRHAQAKNE